MEDGAIPGDINAPALWYATLVYTAALPALASVGGNAAEAMASAVTSMLGAHPYWKNDGRNHREMVLKNPEGSDIDGTPLGGAATSTRGCAAGAAAATAAELP